MFQGFRLNLSKSSKIDDYFRVTFDHFQRTQQFVRQLGQAHEIGSSLKNKHNN